ncbi:hypothetical protein ACHQM5_013343 [Ranunculus cassubicifolius]
MCLYGLQVLESSSILTPFNSANANLYALLVPSPDKGGGKGASNGIECFIKVLTNGIEVKLQRNALSVLEAPTGLEDDDDLECENVQWNGSDMASDDTQKSHRRRHRRHRPAGSSQKTLSRSFSCDSHSKGSVSPAFAPTKVDLSKLELKALWRYWRHFNLMDVVPDPTREQLIDVVRQHFMSTFTTAIYCGKVLGAALCPTTLPRVKTVAKSVLLQPLCVAIKLFFCSDTNVHLSV